MDDIPANRSCLTKTIPELITLDIVTCVTGLSEDWLLKLTGTSLSLKIVKLPDGQYATTPAELCEWFERYSKKVKFIFGVLEREFSGVDPDDEC